MNCIAGCLRGNIVKSVPLIVLWMVISGFFHCSMPTAETVYTLENSHLKVQINPEGFVLDVTDKKTDITYRTESKGSLRLVSESCSTDSCIFGYTASPDNFEFGVSLKLEDNSIVFAVIADPAQSMTKSLNFPGVIRSSEDDYYVIPYAAGIINSVKESYPLGYPRGHFQLWAYKSTMPFAGVTNLESGYMICSDDPWDTEINVVRPDYSTPFYTLQINHHPSKSKFGYTRTFYLTFFESGGYVAMCEWYRRHAESKGYVRTLRDKARANNNIDRLIGAVDLWALHQFRSEYFIDKLRGYGFDRMAFELPMNWNTPDYHPELIDYANGHGFLTSRYDCLTDVYPPTYPDNPYFRYDGYPEDVIVNADGGLEKGWVTYLDGDIPFQGYVACSATHERYARDKLTKELADNHYNCRFIDVELASVLHECYSEVHPATRHDDALYRIRALEVVKEDFNLVTGSEEAHDFAFPFTDYSMGTMSVVTAENAGYDWYHPTDDPGERFIEYSMNPSFRVPLHALVYHDTHVATWYTGDGVSKVPLYWDDKDLFTVLYGTMQVFMPASMWYWNLNLDKFVTSYHLTSSVFRKVGYDRMISHEMISDDWKVQKTEFSNGWTVVANFADNDYYHSGSTLPPKGFVAEYGDEKVIRIRKGGGIIAGVRLDDRLFLNPYGFENEFEGLRSMGPVFLKKEPDHMTLAFIGDFRTVSINPEKLPWPVGSIRVYTKEDSIKVELEQSENGWLKLRRPTTETQFRIEWDDIVAVQETLESPHTPSLSITPNPSNSATLIRYNVPVEALVKLELFNSLGQKARTIVDRHVAAGNYSVAVDTADMPSGMYFVRFSVGGNSVTSKLTILK